MEELIREIGIQIRYFRNKAGLKQLELATILEIDETTLSQWESGRRQISCEDLFRVAMVLGTTPNDLLCFNQRSQEIKERYNSQFTSISISTHEGNILLASHFEYKETHMRKKNRPKYQLYASLGPLIGVTGINRTIIGFYTNKEDLDLELSGIHDAISNGESGYRVCHHSKVRYDLTGMPVLVEEGKQ